jgi:hypothetical protein
MSYKLTFNIGFLMRILGTIFLVYKQNLGGVGTGLLVLCMLMGYTNESTPRD